MFQRVTFDKQVSVEYFEVESDRDSTCDQEWNDYLQALLDQGNYSVFDLHNHSLSLSPVLQLVTYFRA